ncbi:MAG: hypothetical protein HOI23_09310, partial [Deltaproteobacteria bacterium]|nr:hypothetical protein [Deltaproteobacteria bacterium]
MPISTRSPLTNTRYARSVSDTNRSGSSMSALSSPSRDTFSRTSSSGSNWARFSSTPVAAGSANYPSVLSGLSHLGSAQTNNSVGISAKALLARQRHLSTATLEELQKMAGMFITVRSGEMEITKLTREQAEFVVMAQMFGETAVYNQPGFFEKNSMPEDLDAKLRDIVRATFSLPETIAEVGSLDELLSDVAGLQSLGLDTSKTESWKTLNDLQTGVLDPDEY